MIKRSLAVLLSLALLASSQSPAFAVLIEKPVAPLAPTLPSPALTPLSPRMPQGPMRAAEPEKPGPVGRIEGAVAPDLKELAKPDAGPSELAAAGRRLEAAVTGQAQRAYPTSVLAPLTKVQKAEFKERYLAHFGRRNGAPDLRARRFDLREKYFAELERTPVRTARPLMDQAVFDRNETRKTPEAGLTEAQLWALAVAASNVAERDGVEYALNRVDRLPRLQEKLTDKNPLTFIQIEEFYHTRILKDVLATVGLNMSMVRPNWAVRMLVRAMALAPEPLADVIIFCAELAGVAAFRLLRDKAAELDILKSDPTALKRVNELFQQIMVDEVGHVHYVRSRLGPLRLRIARAILPLFTRVFLGGVPALTRLYGKERLLKEVLKADVDGAAAPYADRFNPAGR